MPICVVTGGSRGIGRDCVLLLASRGCSVAFTFCSDELAATKTLEEVQQIAPTLTHLKLKCDVSHKDDVLAVLESVLRTLGRVDVLINNAGVCVDHDVVDSTDFDAWRDALQSTMNVNFFGAADLSFLMTKQLLKQSTENGCRGRIVNITSRAVYRGELTAPGYAASKAALSIFGQSLARRVAENQIFVFTVAPGWVETEMAREAVTGPNAAEVLAQHPLGRIALPEEVAKLVCFLALDAPAAMTGCVIDVNGASYLR